MNKRQKIVQQQFLDNEEAIIKRLKQVYGKSLEDITGKSQALYDEIEELTSVYDDVEDEAEKAVLKSRIQSKVYQKQYQDSLKKQVGDILDKMQETEFKNVSEYLDKCYEEGFVGTMYDLQGQGIPLCFPLDQEAMVRAVQIDSKISQGLYERLGEDVGVLKKKITAQVSRGIATGMTFKQVAQQLSAYTNIGFNNAVRIARTEGHRIQCQSGMDACYKAKEKGADVVKQWDSTLDAKTRESHVQVDGEIKELDEKFSNGLMFPGDPSGGAAEVVNCRCALLQRAKWALDKEELQTLQERAEYFGLDKAETFEEYKKKYLKMAKEIEKPVETTKPKQSADLFSFTDEQSEAIEWYVSGEGQYINQYYRGRVGSDFGELYDSEKILAKRLDEATDRVLPDDIDKLYRSVDAKAIFGDMSAGEWYDFESVVIYGDKYNQAKIQNLIDRTKGKTITEKGFMSTTKNLDVAENWRDFTGSSMPVTLEFDDIPKGLKGVDLKLFDVEGDEQFEVLLARNTKYKVTDVYAKNGQVHIKAQFILDDVPEGLTKVATKTSSFVPAKTVVEAEDYIRKFVDDKQFGALGVSYSGISVEAANKVNETLGELFETFNFDKLGGVFVAKGNTKLGKAVDGAVAAYSPIRKSLILNNKSLKNVDDIVKEHAEELRLIKLYASDPSSIHFKTKRAELVTKASLKSGRATVPDTIEDVINHEMGHALEKAVSQTDKFEIIKQNMSKYAENISGYATSDISEYIAESFASYRKGEKGIDPDLKGVFDSLKKNAGKTLAKNTKSGIISSEVQQIPKFSSKDIKTVVLPKQEYAHVMSELSTHMSEAQRSQPIVKKAIGDHVYTVENNGFGDYRIIGKKPIGGIDISDEEWGD